MMAQMAIVFFQSGSYGLPSALYTRLSILDRSSLHNS